MARVVVNLPGAGPGKPVAVQGLGVFANRESHELDETQVSLYEMRFRQKFPESGEVIIGEPLTQESNENLEEVEIEEETE